MNSPSRSLVVRYESVVEQIRRVLLAEVVAQRVSDDQTTFAPRGTY